MLALRAELAKLQTESKSGLKGRETAQKDVEALKKKFMKKGKAKAKPKAKKSKKMSKKLLIK